MDFPQFLKGRIWHTTKPQSPSWRDESGDSGDIIPISLFSVGPELQGEALDRTPPLVARQNRDCRPVVRSAFLSAHVPAPPDSLDAESSSNHRPFLAKTFRVPKDRFRLGGSESSCSTKDNPTQGRCSGSDQANQPIIKENVPFLTPKMPL